MKRIKFPERFCRECSFKLILNTRRDILKKFFCSRKCTAKWNVRNGILRCKYGAEWRKSLKKPHRITEKLLNAAKERGRGMRGQKRNGRDIECQICKKTFYAPQSRINGGRKYCSKNCRIISLRKPEHLKTNKVRLKKWRKEVLERDKFKCVKCGEDNFDLLQAAHIKSREEYPEFQFDLENGQTLCLTCHANDSPKHLRNLILSAKNINYDHVLSSCLFCKMIYYRKPSQRGKFCSMKCYQENKKQ